MPKNGGEFRECTRGLCCRRDGLSMRRTQSGKRGLDSLHGVQGQERRSQAARTVCTGRGCTKLPAQQRRAQLFCLVPGCQQLDNPAAEDSFTYLLYLLEYKTTSQ